MRESYFYRNRIERTKPNKAVNFFLNPPKALAKKLIAMADRLRLFSNTKASNNIEISLGSDTLEVIK
tara:strand:+ start:261 stop:461 length:201 start_codon:yes stop_codon:yes gene_type:complete